MKEKVRARRVKIKNSKGEATKKGVATKEAKHVREVIGTYVHSKISKVAPVELAKKKLSEVFEGSSAKGVTAKPKLAADGIVIDAIVDRAQEVLGSRDKAYRWLGTPVRGLDFATPIYVLRTKGGAERVIDILGQMEHGIW